MKRGNHTRNENLLSIVTVLGFVVLALSISASNIYAALPVIMGDQGSDVRSISTGELLPLGNLSISIYDDPVAGNLVYNNNFTDAIVNGSWNIMLYNVSLDYGRDYYKDYSINGDDLDFSGAERLAFTSSLGEINITSNITLGQKILFALGSFIQNIVPGWLQIDSSVNISDALEVSGNANIVGNLTVGGVNVCLSDGTNCVANVSGNVSYIYNNITNNLTTYVNTSNNITYNITNNFTYEYYTNITYNITDNITYYVNTTQNITYNITNNFTTYVNTTSNITNNITYNITYNITENITYYVNYTYNLTENITYNITNNITTYVNITNNFTYNITNNYTYNITDNITYYMNYTYNITENITYNITNYVNTTYNITENITTYVNTTYNITNNFTDNITYYVNSTYNITNNITENITNYINTTYNVTNNVTYNITQNITYNITNNYTYNTTYNITYNITNNLTIDNSSYQCSGSDKLMNISILNGVITGICQPDQTGGGGSISTIQSMNLSYLTVYNGTITNLTINLSGFDSRYVSLSNLITLVGNWSLDKFSYNTTAQLDTRYSLKGEYVNVTNNFTTYVNTTYNITNNYTYNFTDNITTYINITNNVTYNITENITYYMNYTYNITNNFTDNITYYVNYTYNITNNITENITNYINTTYNITNNITYNITNDINTTYNITNNYTYNITNNLSSGIFTIQSMNLSYIAVANGSVTNLSVNLSGFDSRYLQYGDQRYNDSAAVAAINSTKLNVSDQRYNDTVMISDVNSSANVQSLGFNTTIQLQSLFYTLSNPVGFVNLTSVVNSVGNWSLDKSSYNTTIQLMTLFLNVSDQRYNDTTRINSVNSTANIRTLGFNTTAELDTRYQQGTEIDTVWNITGSSYLYNNSGILSLNQTMLNATIDARDESFVYDDNFNQELNTTSNPTFNNLNVTGNLTVSSINVSSVSYIGGLIVCNNGTATVMTRNITLAESYGCII